MNIGNAIKTLRSARGLTQRELAHESQLSVAYLCQIEKSQKDPTLSTLESISKAIGMPLSLILFLASDGDDLEGMSQDAHEKLSSSMVNLLKAMRNG